MTVVDINQKEKGSPMFERIDDPTLRERALAAQQYLQEKYKTLGTWKKVAAAIKGVSETQIHGFVGGSYPASPANIVAAIERARSLEAARNATAFESPFVETSIARRIRKAVLQTRVRGQLGTLAGDSGIGKTRTLEAICAEDPSTIYIRCNPTLASKLWPVLSTILRRLGAKAPAQPYLCYTQLVELLTQRGVMLILDEAQQLSRPETLDTLRSLSEDSGTAILFSGNSMLHEFESFLRGSEPAAFTQFTRRVAVKEFIQRAQITRSDITLLAEQHLSEEVLDETLETLLEMVKMPGALGNLHLTLQRAHEKARGTKVTAAQVFASIDETTKRQKRGVL